MGNSLLRISELSCKGESKEGRRIKNKKEKEKAIKPISVPERKKGIEKLIAVSGAFYAFLFVS